jgi:Ca-activated chloride channel family protein
MSFESPQLLYFLFALPVLAGLKAWADWHGGKAVGDFTAPRLRQMLVTGMSQGRSWLIFALQLIALACFVFALARPRWGEEKAPLMESGRNVLIAIDTSRSMLANDVAPDRVTRAKLAAQDLLTVLRADRVGLIAFAGNAYLQAPLTTDHEAVIESIQALDFTSIPRGGSEIGRALKLAMETLEKSPARNHGLVLFSDGGEPNPQITKYAKDAAKKNILIITVGVGTEAGALIPDPDPERMGDYVRDRAGNVVKTKLESGVLQEIATATRGRYLKLGSQPLAASVVKEMLATLQAQTNSARELVKPIERFYWPLSIGILLLMIAWFIRPSSSRFRPAPVAVLAALVLGSAPAPAHAHADIDSLASLFSGGAKGEESPEAAHNFFEKGDYEKAKKVYGKLVETAPAQPQYAYGLGASAFHLKDYDRAVGAFSGALESADTAVQNRAHRGVAHSLYDQGDHALAKQPKFTLKAWRDSVRHFDAALKIDPNNTEVRENREFVKKRLDELQKQMDQQEQKGKKGDKKKGQKGQKGEKGEGEEGEEGEESGEDGDKEDEKPKDSLAKTDGEKEKEEALPEGKIKADEDGKGEDGEKEQEQEQAEEGDNERHEATGFSRNEARSFLRTYADDQKKAQLMRQRDEPVNGKDW